MKASSAFVSQTRSTEARLKALLAKGAADRQSYDDAQYAAERLAGEVAVLEDRIERQSRLRAVSEGVVRARLMEPGDMVTTSIPVFEVAVTTPKWVRVWVSETQLGFVKEGAEALVTTDTTPPMTGVVGFVSPEAEFTPKTVQTQDLRTVLVYEVRLTVEDPENALKLGQPVTVDFAGAAK